MRCHVEDCEYVADGYGPPSGRVLYPLCNYHGTLVIQHAQEVGELAHLVWRPLPRRSRPNSFPKKKASPTMPPR